jgi:hypothetical protein
MARKTSKAARKRATPARKAAATRRARAAGQLPGDPGAFASLHERLAGDPYGLGPYPVLSPKEGALAAWETAWRNIFLSPYSESKVKRLQPQVNAMGADALRAGATIEELQEAQNRAFRAAEIAKQEEFGLRRNPWVGVGVGAGAGMNKRKRKSRKNPLMQMPFWIYANGAIRERFESSEAAHKAAKRESKAWRDVPYFVIDARVPAHSYTMAEYLNGVMQLPQPDYRAEARARRNPMYPPEKVRTVRLSPYRKGAGPTFTLELWDLNESDREGRFLIGYKLAEKQPNQKRSRVLFECKDPACAVHTRDAVDSDDAVRDVLMWLTLKPGDTDASWFENYTPDQMDFAQTDAEALQMLSIERFGER